MHEVLIDVTRLLGRFLQGRLPTGVDRVSLAYIEHYRPRARALVRWHGVGFELSRPASEALFQRLLCPDARHRPGTRKLVAHGIVTALGRPRSSGRLLINTGHVGLEHPGYARILAQRQVRLVFLLHDLIPLSHPEYCRPGEGLRHRTRLDNMIGLASGIITNSRATLADLNAYAQDAGRDLPPTQAALLASGLPSVAPGPRPVAGPYFVFLSTVEPRKNHWLLLHLWRHIIADLGPAAPRLVVIGQRGWECEQVVDLLERCEPLRGFVIEHARCSDSELATYLHHAEALLFPSFAEGYGMPVAEALSLGVPVIASDLPVFAEIAGDVPEYIDPLDGRRWREVIEAYCPPDSPRRAAQLARMARFAVPTWAGHFARVDAFLEMVRARSDR
ncbi:glycosyltransferase family 1 protein [uncultured Thiodictyon sp.]|uniref:glycosyltransferase family 4 protein n=1 Tax=uncultured Thiodictyon sp. TaxID=1846217 RepID=UPI0025D40947|nr:glycosyltransferase family 1 protein [uncultured Thiodictyon sp.]